MKQEMPIEPAVDEAEYLEHAREIVQSLQSVDPAQVHCIVGVVVLKPANDGEDGMAHTFALGSGEDISRMITLLVNFRAKRFSGLNDEVTH